MEEKTKIYIGKIFAIARLTKNLSLYDTSKLTGKAKQYLSKLESGKLNFLKQDLDKICEVYGLEIKLDKWEKDSLNPTKFKIIDYKEHILNNRFSEKRNTNNVKNIASPYEEEFEITIKPRDKKQEIIADKLFNIKKGEEILYYSGCCLHEEARYLAQVVRFLVEDKKVIAYQQKASYNDLHKCNNFAYFAKGI